MIHPLLGLVGVALAFFISFFIFFQRYLEVEYYFYISVFILIGVYTFFALFRDREIYLKRRWFQDPMKILGKTFFWGVMAYIPCLIYEKHSFYSQAFPMAVRFFRTYFDLYLWGALPYFLLSEKFRYSYSNFLNDPYIRILSVIRRLLKFQFSVLRRFVQVRQYRTFLVSSLLRIHFIPVMINQMFFTHGHVAQALNANEWDYKLIVSTVMALIWSMDANNASIGYFWESNFTKTRFKAMDPYPLHWIVTLICYAPFSIWASTFLPSILDYNNASGFISEAPWFQYTTDFLTLFFLIGYISAGISLYFSTSNMTYKAIQTKGLYALVRHPATFCKLGFFGVSIFKFTDAYTFLNIFAYILWTFVYIGRTICEERFLSHFQEYKEYKKKTPYRLIPGVY